MNNKVYSNNYYKQREIDSLNKIDEICKELPNYVKEFIVGKSDYTSPLTRLNYMFDLRIFFDFLSKKVIQNPTNHPLKSHINYEFKKGGRLYGK